MDKLKDDPDRCICCGAIFVDGKGWVEEHKFPCANDRYGWLFTIKDSEREKRRNQAMLGKL